MSGRRFRVGASEVTFEAHRRGPELTLQRPEGGTATWVVRRVGSAEFAARATGGEPTAHTIYAVRDGGDWWVHLDGRTWRLTAIIERDASAAPGGLASPIPAKVTDVFVADGDAVTSGQVLVVLSAMKMQLELKAPWDGTVRDLTARSGDNVDAGRPLLRVEPSAQPDAANDS